MGNGASTLTFFLTSKLLFRTHNPKHRSLTFNLKKEKKSMDTESGLGSWVNWEDYENIVFGALWY